MTEKILNTQVIEGFIIEDTICDFGLEAIAVANGKIICSHFSSNEEFAKADLGFNHFLPESAHNAIRKHESYLKIFPNGYEMKWCGIKKWNYLTSHILIRNNINTINN